MTASHQNALATLLALLLGSLLLVAAIAKAKEPAETVRALTYFVGDQRATAGVAALIAVEAIVGAALLTGIAPKRTAIAAIVLFSAFATWAMFLWWSRAPLSCGCGLKFIPFLERSDPPTVAIRAGIGVALAIVLFALWRQPSLTERRLPRENE
ncbi:MAG: hypothetical protein J0L78_13715 [Planctomycetes bacterium]|nr:hypothetical protein [Planctomycetota bacterium]